MTIKAVVDDINAVPEALRGFYTEQDGKFTLTVDGLVSKNKLDEFRQNNITLAQERDALKQQFDGIDPKTARELLAKAQAEKDKTLIDAGKVDELVAQRVEAMRTDFDAKLTGATSESKKLRSQLESLLIDGAIRDSAVRAGVRASAIEDVLLRGRTVFKLVDGKAVPMQGDKPIFGKTGDAMSMDEWLSGLTTTATHLFEPNRGAGATGGASGQAFGGKHVNFGDNKGFIDNLSDIAAGRVKVK